VEHRAFPTDEESYHLSASVREAVEVAETSKLPSVARIHQV
jgi:hypothetical protein